MRKRRRKKQRHMASKESDNLEQNPGHDPGHPTTVKFSLSGSFEDSTDSTEMDKQGSTDKSGQYFSTTLLPYLVIRKP